MHDLPAPQELIRGDMNEAGGLADAPARGDDADVPPPQSAVRGLFQDPEGTAGDELSADHADFPSLFLFRYSSFRASAIDAGRRA
jgi:hypothetical protein